MKAKILVWILAVFCLVGAVQGALTDGLVSAWKLDNNLYDSLNLNNGTNNSVTFNNTIYRDGGYSGVFDGSSSYVDLGDPASLKTGNFTISAWIYPDSAPIQRTIYTRRVDINTNMQFYFEGENTLTLYMAGAGTSCNVDQAEAVYSGVWNHVVATFNGTWVSLYRNGTLILNETCTATAWIGGAAQTTIGRLGIAAYYWDGEEDEIYFWNRSLSASEILTLYNSTPYYPFSISATTDLYITAKDSWNSSNISSFNVNISWSNGTTTSHASSGGNVYLSNLSNGGTAYNITFWNVTNYFNSQNLSVTLVNATNNTLVGYLHQAELCLNASSKVSGAAITANNFTISSTVRSSCFNLSSGNHNVMAQKIGWFSKNQTFTVAALSNTTRTVENMSYANLTIYVRDANGSAYLSGYALNLTSLNYTSWPGENYSSTSNQSFSLINGTYHVDVDMPGYALTDAEANITVAGHTNYTFWLYATNTVNITFLYEANGTLAAGPTISADLIVGDANATSGSTTTGYMWIEGLTPGEYEIRYSTTDFQERSYFFTLTNRTYNELILYLLEDAASEDILINLFDEFTNPLEGYTIKLLRYYAAENGYVEVDMGRTNSEGQTQLRAIRNGPYYKFRILDSDGTVLQTTSATQIYDLEINLYVTLGGNIGQLLENLNGVSYELTYLNSTKQFKFSWDNPDNTVTNAELKIYTTTPLADTLYNSSSTASSSGTIYLSIAEVNGTTYKAQAYLTFSGDSSATLVDTLTHTFDAVVSIFGKYGLLLTFFIVLAVALVGIWSPAALTILVPTAITVTRIAQFHSLGKTWIAAIWAVGFIILYIIRDKS
jgi:hypothetical protein